MKIRITALIATLAVADNVALSEETKRFPRPGWMSWLQVDYPARFVMEPKCLQGEAKWWAKFDDPDSYLSFEIGAFGYVSDLDLILTIPGFTYENHHEELRENHPIEELIAAEAKHKNIDDYFRVEILPQDSEESKFPGFERFIHKKKDRVIVFYLDSRAA